MYQFGSDLSPMLGQGDEGLWLYFSDLTNSYCRLVVPSTGHFCNNETWIHPGQLCFLTGMAYRLSDISDIGKYWHFFKYRISYRMEMSNFEISDIG